MEQKKRVVATVECRMTSSRLPGKILMEAVAGKSFLELIIERLKRATSLDEIVIATTVNSTDDPVAELADRLNVGCFRGSEEDVLGRVLGAARAYDADIIVELHGDCPFVDPELVCQMVDLYQNNSCDYAKNFEPNSFPDGLEVQVFSTKLLEEADRSGNTKEDREHVSWYFRMRPEIYTHITLTAPPSLTFPDLKLTLDTPEDLRFVKKILPEIYQKNPRFNSYDLITFLKEKNEL